MDLFWKLGQRMTFSNKYGGRQQRFVQIFFLLYFQPKLYYGIISKLADYHLVSLMSLYLETEAFIETRPSLAAENGTSCFNSKFSMWQPWGFMATLASFFISVPSNSHIIWVFLNGVHSTYFTCARAFVLWEHKHWWRGYSRNVWLYKRFFSNIIMLAY